MCLSRRAWLPASEPYVECVCVCVTVSVCECSFVVCVRQIHHHIYAPVFCVILHPIFLQYFSVFFCAAAICQQRALPKFYCMGISFFFFFVCKGEKPMSWCRWVWADLADPVKSLMVAHLLFLFNLPSLSAGRSVQHSGGQEWRETSVLFPNYFISYYHKATCWLQFFFLLQDIVNAQEKLDKCIYFGFSLLFIFIFYLICETWFPRDVDPN